MPQFGQRTTEWPRSKPDVWAPTRMRRWLSFSSDSLPGVNTEVTKVNEGHGELLRDLRRCLCLRVNPRSEAGTNLKYNSSRLHFSSARHNATIDSCSPSSRVSSSD